MKKKKFTKEELYKMDAVEVYKLVLEKKYIKKFPNGFWQQPEAIDNAIKCTKYLIEDILKLNEKELKEQLATKLFKKNGLTGMLDTCFKGSPYELIKTTYPEKEYKPWDFNNVPQGYWNNIDNGISATKWLIETKLQISDEELKEQLSVNLFRENGLGTMLQYCFNGSPYDAINLAYPERHYKPWEFNNVPTGYWNDINNRVNAIKWLIEIKLKLTEDDLKEKLSVKLFIDNGLGGMLATCFNNSPYDAINLAYPKRHYQPWDFNNVPQGYWNDVNNGISATKWLIETKLQLNEEGLKEQLSAKLFQENGLGTMLHYCFNGSPYDAINLVYPERDYQPWEFNNVPIGYWGNINNGIKATKWLIETKLKLSEEELREQLSIKLFRGNGLRGMLNYCFNGSPYEAINTAYPNKFKKEDFKNYK